MFDGWYNFYSMVGQAAATLIGLMFVIVTLGAALGTRLQRTADQRTVRLFVTPTLVHFGAILFISMLALVPPGSRVSVLASLLACGLAGFTYVAAIGGRILSSGLIEKSDYSARAAFVPLPAIAYLLIVVSSISAFRGWPAPSLTVGAATAILLSVGIRNAWAMALFAVQNDARELENAKEPDVPAGYAEALLEVGAGRISFHSRFSLRPVHRQGCTLFALLKR